MATVRDAVFGLLRKHGINIIFGNPGSNELPFLDNFPEDFRYVLALHEGVAVAMADGYAQATGRPAMVSLHAAAGTGNGMGALTNAQAARSPLLVTAGQQLRNIIGLEPLLANVDAPLLPRPLVKWSYEPAVAADVPRAFSQALHAAALAPSGPVYLSIPYDDWAAPAPTGIDALATHTASSVTTPPSALIDAWLERLHQARSPVLILGADVDAAGAQEAAIALAEAQVLPVWIAPMPARCPFPNTHPNFRGVLPAGMATIARLLDGHDLILAIGAPVFRYHQFDPGAVLPEGASLLHVTCDPQEAARASVGEAVVADIGATLRALAAGARQSEREAPKPRPAPAPAQESAAGPLAPEAVFDVIASVAPQNAVYVNESTSTVTVMWDRLKLEQPGSYYFPAAGGLGFGLPAALGVQLANPDRRVIGVIGDGSAQYAITGLWTAAQYNIPAVFVILKNGVYGALRWFGKVLKVEGLPGLDVPDIDFCALAAGYGVAARRAETPEALVAALSDALAGSAPVLIEVPTVFQLGERM